MEIEQESKLCTHFQKLDKKKLHQLLDSWAKEGVCYNNHPEEAKPANPNLLISLSSNRVGCSRNTDHQCLKKDFDKSKDICITLNPVDGTIWYASLIQVLQM